MPRSSMLVLLVVAETVLGGVGAAPAPAPAAVRQPARPELDAALGSRTPTGVRPRRVTLVLTVSPGWHIGAAKGARGGTAGLPTTVEWAMAPGWRVVSERWPVPERQIVGRDTLLTYAGRVEVEAVLDAPASVPPSAVRAVVAYGLCRDMCIPGWATVTLGQ